jgi:hypothetical protein
MGADSSADKRGLRSSGKKRQTTRHADRPTPATSPVPGAFGKEGPDAERERTIAEERAEDESSSSH